MQPHGTLKRLISLASVVTVLVEKHFVASYMDPGVEYSHTTKNVFEMYYGADISHLGHVDQHLSHSQYSFNSLAHRIDVSMQNGHYIHVEDGEADDYMHNLIAAMRGEVPRQVYLQGGHYKKRLAVAHTLWDYLASKFGIEKPEILTISAPITDFASFDSAEGTAILSKSQISSLTREASPQDYQTAVNHAHTRLRETLESNDFTTIALKTAPAGLTGLLSEFRHKVAIIWTGPIEKRAKTNTYEKMFNYYQAVEAADYLLTLNIPTIIVSPWLNNARMTSIIDARYMDEFKQFVKPVEGFGSFAGFRDLASIQLNKNAKFSYYINFLADKFRDEIIKAYEKDAKEFKVKQKTIEKDRSLTETERLEQLTELENERERKLALGKRWAYFRGRNSLGQTFREFCPMDQTVELVTDPSLRASVQEVLEVDLKPSPTNEKEVKVVPMIGGNTFIISKFDSTGLENKIQAVIDWMAAGEPSPSHYHSGSSH